MGQNKIHPLYPVDLAELRAIANIAECLKCLTYLSREEAENSQAVRHYADMSDERLSCLWELLQTIKMKNKLFVM